MKFAFHLAGVLLATASATLVLGHGTPVQVAVESGRLVVSGGVPDPNGFASNVFVEGDEDGDPFAELTLPQFGPVIVWQIPGFDISGMAEQSSLSLEVLRRPVTETSPTEERTLWYWNDQTDLVEPAPGTSALHLLAQASQSRTLAPADTAAPPPLLLANPVAGQQGFHNHGLLSYALDNDPAPPSGTYGFFARLTSDEYQPSDPFLIVLNKDVLDYEQMIPAALAINAAAIDAEAIPGDYDTNGIVNMNDYTYWRARFGNVVTPSVSPDGNGNGAVDAADYVVWREAMSTGGAGDSQTAMIPEPQIAALLSTAAMAIASVWRRRTRT